MKPLVGDFVSAVESAIEQRRAAALRRQRDAFLALLLHVWQKSRFYRDLYSAAGITERDLAAVHLGDLPLIDKKLLMDNFDQAVTDPRLRKSNLERWMGEVGDPGLNYLDEFVVCQSSGSSGVKGVSVCAYRDWQLASSAMASRLPPPVNHGTGKTKVAFYLIVNGNHSGVSGAVRMPRSIYELRILSILDGKEKVIDRLNEFQPQQLHGYASSIHELSRLALTGELRISPQRIFVSGEKLTDEMERRIHQAWASHLIDSYSASESRFIAFKQSGETEMNIIDELNILEILDSANRQVGTNGSGRVVLTSLYNATLPLIRYEMGDNLVCGAANLASPLKTIKEISGRATDALPVTLRDGSEGAISPLVLASFFCSAPGEDPVRFTARRPSPDQLRQRGGSRPFDPNSIPTASGWLGRRENNFRGLPRREHRSRSAHRQTLLRCSSASFHIRRPCAGRKRDRDRGLGRACCLFDADDRKSSTAGAVRSARTLRHFYPTP